MSPLHVEEFNPSRKEWVKINEVHPTDPPRSISDNKPAEQEIFTCLSAQQMIQNLLFLNLGPV